MKKRALITGIDGMDGSHLADFLLTKNYEVWGMRKKQSPKNRINTNHLTQKIHVVYGDLLDQESVNKCIIQSKPHEIYNLGSNHGAVRESWYEPESAGNINGLGVLRILEAIRHYDKKIKFYQASSSEMFGKTKENPSKETTAFCPRSPYGVAKLYGHWMTKNYRESYNMYACSGILFNHESERRGIEFVTRKISDGVARIKHGLVEYITLGNLEAKRDWGYAPDYVEAMWLMLQQEIPRDYVIATGESHSIRDFLDIAFDYIGITDWTHYIKQDPQFMRPAEVNVSRGDYSKAKTILGWSPKTDFKELVKIMVEYDIKLLGEK